MKSLSYEATYVGERSYAEFIEFKENDMRNIEWTVPW